MKLASLREKSQEELVQEVNELTQELFKLRFRHATHQLEDNSQLREVKRNIARVKTILRERELEAQRKA
ncbi:MAG: 50S ribosomal protein L29 [Eubacteriales bacterium]|nr:50S ribosomal protein L29 [Eubacteriales bacterium]